MMSKKEIERWLSTLPDDADIAIDEGGLAIVMVDKEGEETDIYLEIGMTPAEEEIAG